MDKFPLLRSMGDSAMNEDEEKLSVYDDVCRVIGWAVVILKETGQPVSLDRIKSDAAGVFRTEW
ncbi:hypothetical protein ACSLWB_04765 [Salmonella enterica]